MSPPVNRVCPSVNERRPSAMGNPTSGYSAPRNPVPLERSGQWPMAAQPPPLSHEPTGDTLP